MSPLRIAYRRAEILGFWIVLAALCGGTGAAGAALTGRGAPWRWGLVLAAASVAPGVVRRRWFEDVVWAWNGCVRRIAAGLRWWVLTTSYFTVVTLVGRARPSTRLDEGGAGWSPIETDAAASARDLAALCRRRQQWAIVLVPVLTLLAVLGEDEPEREPPSTTYTLY